MFCRGDLVLERNSERYSSYEVLLLVRNNIDDYWWCRRFGDLDFTRGWNKYDLTSIRLSETCIKLPLSALSDEKQRTYQEFKENYLDKDLV